METHRATDFLKNDISVNFVQETKVDLSRGTLRGLHYQLDYSLGQARESGFGRNI